MFFGRNEENGLRCVYHGWKFDTTGTCVDMPSEPAESNFKSKVRIGAYPTHESGGIVWCYMGPPETMTPFRDLIGANLDANEYRAVKSISDCNWVQGLEGNLDTAHISFLHRALADFALQPDETDAPGYPSDTTTTVIRGGDKAPAIEIQDTWYGFRYAGLRRTPAGHTHARVTDFIMPFMCYIATVPVGGDNCLMMVPIDDDHFFRMSYATKRSIPAPGRSVLASSAMGAGGGRMTAVAAQSPRPRASRDNDYYLDREKQRTLSYTGIPGIAQQDMAVTESMGAIYDRSHEHLGTTDAAVIRMRRMLIKAAKDLANGIEPPGRQGDFAGIRSAEKVLEPGEDWRRLGTEADPVVLTATAGR